MALSGIMPVRVAVGDSPPMEIGHIDVEQVRSMHDGRVTPEDVGLTLADVLEAAAQEIRRQAHEH
jgi:hypothetical protein